MSESAGAPPRPPRPPTIYDVAERAGVAASTVSRAFARPGRVNSLTAERIRTAATALGYRTHSLVPAAPTGRTSIRAISVSDVTNPFYADIIRGAQSAATEADFTLMLFDGQESYVMEQEAVGRAMSSIEGLVLASSRMSDTAIRTTAKQKPVVVLNRFIREVPSLVTDNAGGVRQALEHLQERRHRSVTYIAGPEASWADGDRWRALRTIATGMEITTRRIGPFPPTVKGGEAATQQLRRHPLTAVLAYNDQIAIGVIRSLTAAGYRVPADVSVIGFDDIFASSLVTPALTTIAAPLRQMGKIAVRNLLAIINGATPTAHEALVVPTRLIRRESTGVAKRAPLTEQHDSRPAR